MFDKKIQKTSEEDRRIDNGNMSAIVFIELKKALDTVDHAIPFNNLNHPKVH